MTQKSRKVCPAINNLGVISTRYQLSLLLAFIFVGLSTDSSGYEVHSWGFVMGKGWKTLA
jgi:hypothetical protein